MPDQLLGGDGNNVQVYRWKDAEGNWQFSDSPPENTAAEQVLVNTDLNRDLVPEFTPSPQIEEPNRTGKAILLKEGGSKIPPIASPDKVGQLIEDAKGVQDLMNERAKQLESVR